MLSIRLPANLRELSCPNLVRSAGALILFVIAPLCVAQTPAVPKSGADLATLPAATTQPGAIISKTDSSKLSPGEKAKADAAELATLADQLRDRLHELNVNVLPLDVIQKTEAIEKLAKKIKGESGAR